MKKCSKKYCGRPAKQGALCYKHWSEKWRNENPLKYAYYNLKSNARRRNHSFDLTLDQFDTFCKATDYLKLKGRYKSRMTIDRIDSSKGYSLDNIQMMKQSDNIKKRWVEYWQEQERLEYEMNRLPGPVKNEDYNEKENDEDMGDAPF